MDLALRPRSASEIVDAAFRLVRRHAAAFLTLSAVAAVPRLALAVAQLGTSGASFDPAEARVAAAPFVSPTYWALAIAGLLVTGLFEGAFLSLADDALRAEQPTAGRALARGMARAVPVVVTFLLVLLIATVGFAFLVVPGIYLGLRLYPAVATATLEGVGPAEALGRAWRRTRGAAGRAFGVYALVLGIFFLASVAATMVGGVIGGLLGAATGGGAAGVGRAAFGALVVVALTQVLAGLVLYPLLSAANALFYYDTRVRSEAFDVELMVDALGAPGAAPAGGR
jgi:hypothetical protein